MNDTSRLYDVKMYIFPLKCVLEYSERVYCEFYGNIKRFPKSTSAAVAEREYLDVLSEIVNLVTSMKTAWRQSTPRFRADFEGKLTEITTVHVLT